MDRADVNDLDLGELRRHELPGDREDRQQRHAQALFQHLFRRLEVVELHNHPGRGPGADEQGLCQFVVAGGPFEHDQTLGDHVGEAGGPSARNCVPDHARHGGLDARAANADGGPRSSG